MHLLSNKQPITGNLTKILTYNNIITFLVESCNFCNMCIFCSNLYSIWISVNPAVCLSFCLSVFMPVCLSLFLPVCLTVCLSVCLSVFLSVCLSVYLSVCPACLFLCLWLVPFFICSLNSSRLYFSSFQNVSFEGSSWQYWLSNCLCCWSC